MAKVKITRTEMRHEGGTKRYAVFQFSTPKLHIIVTNWGRLGVTGQAKMLSVSHSRLVSDGERTKAIEAKLRRGYKSSHIDEVDMEIDDIADYARLPSSMILSIQRHLKGTEFVSDFPEETRDTRVREAAKKAVESIVPKTIQKAWGTW